MWTPVSALTSSPLGIFATGARPGFQVENSSTVSWAVHLPNWHPSNGHAFSSILGSVGLGALRGVSAGFTCAAHKNMNNEKAKKKKIRRKNDRMRGSVLEDGRT